MKPELKKLLILNAPYLLFVYLFDKIGQAVRLSPGADLSGKVLSLADGFSAAFANPLPSLAPMDLLIGIVGAVLIRLMVYFKGKNAKKYRKGIEYGSARWGNAEDIKPYTDPVFQNNVLLTQTERLTMNSRPKQPKYARNKNILVIGGSGSGKTRFFVKPNLMQMHSSYVVTDPKGTVLVECGKLLQRGGYRIKVLNTINFKKSMKYNPFAYLRSEKDILKLVNTLIANTKGDGEKAGEDFWVKSERLFYCALIGYIWYEAPEEEKNFTTLLEMINASEAREDDPEFQSPVDLMFERLEEKDPEHFAVRQYKKFLLSAGKTRSSILISCGARLAPFDIKELRDLMETDEMELDTIGDRKTALFVIISDTDDTFNFVVSILYTQLFNLLCDKADDEYGGRLPVHVRCLLDEFANIGQIPKFEKLIATIRSREISASIILQSQSQLKAIYKDNADTIVGNCDTTLFLGGKEKTTLKEMSEILGKETIDSFNTSENRGREVSHGLNYQKLGKQLMTKDILKLVNTLIANTKGDGEKAGEDFWVKSERLFYCALIGYIWYEAPEEEKNFTTLLEMINASEAREDDPEFQSPVDLMFERLEEKDPEHFAVRQYKKFLLSAGKTRSSILISCGARLAPFDIKELRDLMETDEMELDTIGDRKTALFVIISDTDDTFNFVVSILYTQLFNLLCDKADDEYGGRLPVHVRCLLDEFANIGQIPKFEKLIATIRSREISASIILQSQSQLKAIYKDNADTIVGNCDTTLFLGGKEKTTLKEMSEILGKETIDSFNTSENRGREVSHGLNYQKLGKQLMTEDEIAVMDGGKCILQLRGVRPFFSDKYDITKHPNYKYLSDYDKKNTFDMEKHLRRRPALVKPDEVFDYYEISESDLQEDTDHE
ncbi:conjugative transfer protein Tn1549-like, CTn4-Orf4 [Clostridioides difficile]|nr:type IV secretory system conjugative DNA transfer family protein [Clostridioides difficile]VFH28281.1 conjugative transfer protein Tn1549-like, CTn4-Orf4 [Clostridioides difficile]